jgi:hypothetical protein
MENYLIAQKINCLSKIGECFMLESEKSAQEVWKYLNPKKKFKISKNTIWRIEL